MSIDDFWAWVQANLFGIDCDEAGLSIEPGG